MSTQLGAAAPPDGIIPNFEHPQDILYTVNLVVEIVCLALVVPFVSLRIYIRARVMRQTGKEDWACVAAGVRISTSILFAFKLTSSVKTLATLYFIAGILLGHFGGGFHIWDVTEGELVKYQKVLYADSIMYGPTAFLTKITLLLIFARASTPYKKMMAFIWAFMGTMLVFYTIVTFLKVGLCKPINVFWNPNIKGTCLNEHVIFIADTVMSVLSDLAILALPVPLLWSLQMSLRKKLRIAVLLGAGGVATAASVIRLVLIVGPLPTDRTVAGVQFKLLGVAEVAIGLLCACLPTFNILFVQVKEERIAAKTRFATDIKMSRIGAATKSSRLPTRILQESYVEVGSSENVSTWRRGESWQRDTDPAGDDNIKRYSCHVVSDAPPSHQSVQGQHANHDLERGRKQGFSHGRRVH